MYATERYQGWLGGYVRNSGISPDMQMDYEPPKEQNSAHQRVVMTISLVKRKLFHLASPFQWLEDFTTIMCKPRYEINSYSALLVHSSASLRMQQGSKLPETYRPFEDLDGLHPFAMLKSIANLVEFRETGNHSAADGSSLNVPLTDATYMHTPTPIFSIADMTFDDGLESMMDPPTLLEKGPELLKGVLAQVFHSYYMGPSTDSVLGIATSLEQRYQVQLVTVVLMTSFLGLSAVFCVGIIIVRLVDSVPMNPTTVASMASYLAASPDLQRHFTSPEPSRDSIGVVFQARVHAGSFGVTTNHGTQNGSRNTPSTAGCWRPISSRNWFPLGLVTLTLIIVAALETVQQVADRKDGIATLKTTDSSSKVPATYVPAAILVGITVLFRKVHLTATLLASLRRLKRRSAPAQLLTVSMMGGAPLHTI